jgi:hypothetical protein
MAMSCTFYVLPARDVLGRQFAGFLTALFPGLDWTATSAAELGETLAQLAENQENVFVVHRDELPGDTDLESALARGYGAEKGDLVVEVADGRDTHPAPARLWRVTTEFQFADDDALEDIDEGREMTAGAGS